MNTTLYVFYLQQIKQLKEKFPKEKPPTFHQFKCKYWREVKHKNINISLNRIYWETHLSLNLEENKYKLIWLDNSFLPSFQEKTKVSLPMTLSSPFPLIQPEKFKKPAEVDDVIAGLAIDIKGFQARFIGYKMYNGIHLLRHLISCTIHENNISEYCLHIIDQIKEQFSLYTAFRALKNIREYLIDNEELKIQHFLLCIEGVVRENYDFRKALLFIHSIFEDLKGSELETQQLISLEFFNALYVHENKSENEFLSYLNSISHIMFSKEMDDYMISLIENRKSIDQTTFIQFNPS